MSIRTEHEANNVLSTPALGIVAGSKPNVENVNAFVYKVGGKIYPEVTAATQLPNLTGSIPDDYQAAYSFFVSYNEVTSAHVFTVQKSENYHVSLPFETENIPLSSDEAYIGSVIVSNTSGSTFDGNVTDLDAVGIATLFINNFGFVGK